MRRSHDMPFGACLLPCGSVRFRLWAPAVRQVELILNRDDGQENILPMHSLADGWFQIETSPQQAQSGTFYRYRLDGELDIPDPASRARSAVWPLRL